ncbi:methylated-DNA-[protein]-cysteine S-methyltransferase [Bacillus pakistanensis]|uniref:Methylated-DNA-[protein]-cysteine S-methyltransferase n=1 Tax=Rossellomorea pakistanensis TaxID=992288 RepID=A0ABS2N6M7_9BACI|nr:methylated-DNA--[protein]-cysteine S-methyltransferase [Bacillus pakistanensis]MBM7583495.1 methylated-DNA-[protein]-cysteine S-methyltransferase [Bacillus pakistanensis]
MKNSRQMINWSTLTHDNWLFYLAATPKGLCYVGSPNGSFTEMKDWVTRRIPEFELKEDDQVLNPYKVELLEYFNGKRESFTYSIDAQGTSFQQEIWNALKRIPYGETYTYSQIAEWIQKPTAVRAVGTAIGANPVLISVPCHRVIGKNGTLTGYRGGLDMKKYLLHLEKGEGTNG